jgi:hypothetical protein
VNIIDGKVFFVVNLLLTTIFFQEAEDNDQLKKEKPERDAN